MSTTQKSECDNAIDYAAFIENKRRHVKPCGFEPENVNGMLFDFQKDIVRWACRKGKAAIFADCGLGKTAMQLEWARQVCEKTGGSVIILAPLAVAAQTKREGDKFGIAVNICREMSDVKNGINVTNYEIMHKFDMGAFSGVVLDESSILKSYTASTRNQIIDSFKDTEYKLACTATPSPNDYMELGNHSEFLGAMTRTEMLAMFFIHDGGSTSNWRLKGHAQGKFWDFVASWAVMLRNPLDMGYEIEGFNLPPMTENVIEIESGIVDEGRLFSVAADGLLDQGRAKRKTIEQRAQKCADLVNGNDRPWVVWCELNDESAMLASLIPDAVEVRGSDTPQHKEDAMLGFADGKYRVIVTKPSICGFGMNWQHCADMCFCGLSNSYEQYYQAIRRCYRFGQDKPVNVSIVISDLESSIVANVMRKKDDASDMEREMIARATIVKTDSGKLGRDNLTYMEETIEKPDYKALMGDCVQRIAEIEDNSIGFSVFSPPFASLYTYSNSDYDMGNSSTNDEFNQHFMFLVNELYRVLKPGRNVSFHCMNLPTSKERDGFIGIRDFRGELIRMFIDAGFIYHSEVTIWKDPVTAMQRTKALGLLNKQKNKDSSLSRQGIPDYLVTMRKPGENDDPICHNNEQFPISEWQKIASPVWMDINPSDTLQFKTARENNDERHICPLQLGVINRALDLWSKPGDTVLSPFMGIGSEGYCSIKKGRKFIGIELKPSYYRLAVKNLDAAVQEANELTLFDFLEVTA